MEKVYVVSDGIRRYICVNTDETGESVIATIHANTDETGYGAPYHGEDRESNAAFIVRACNAHDALVGALEYVVKWHRDNDSGEGELYGRDYVTTCIAALKAAKGE